MIFNFGFWSIASICFSTKQFYLSTLLIIRNRNKRIKLGKQQTIDWALFWNFFATFFQDAEKNVNRFLAKSKNKISSRYQKPMTFEITNKDQKKNVDVMLFIPDKDVIYWFSSDRKDLQRQNWQIWKTYTRDKYFSLALN